MYFIFTRIISSHVRMYLYFLLDVRANQSGGTWVPWSIDSFEKYTSYTLYMHNIISCTLYLLFSFGCSGEPVRRYVSSLKYRFLWKIHSCTLYLCIISSHVRYICYFLLDVRANQSGGTWVPWSIDSFEKYSTFMYFTYVISSHVRMYLLFSFGCSGEPVAVREFPEV